MNFKSIYQFILSQSADPNNPKVLLKELLQLHNFIYKQLSSVAVAYGNGTHPKHRVTKYHDFFVDNTDENESVLDLGSGRGDVTYDVAKKTKNQVIGMDMNGHNLAYANSTYQADNLKFVKGNICTDVPLNHFDVVIMSNVLEHLKDRVELLRTITERTTPNKILLRIPYFEREWMVPIKQELGVEYFLDPTHEIEYRYEEFYAEMEQAGLKVDSLKANWGEIWAVCVKENKDEL